MTKRLKAIIIVCCIGVLGIAAYFIAYSIIANQSSPSTETITITSMSASNVASIKVTLANGDYYYVTEDASVSATSSSVTYKTTFSGIYSGLEWNASRARSLVSASTLLTAVRDLGEAEKSEYSAYGLDEPLSTVVLTKTDGKEIIYYVGSRSTSGLYYFRVEGNEHIYVINSSVGETFTRTPNEMRVSMLPLETGLENIRLITVQSEGNEPITIEYDADASVYNPFSLFYTTAPWHQRRPANPDLITSLAQAMASITVQDYVTPLADGSEVKLSEYGLDKPWGYVKEVLADGTVYEYSFGNYTDDVEYYCYAYDHISGQIYIIVHDKATFVSKYTAIQLTTPYIINAMMSDMKYVYIEFGGEKHTLECIRTYYSEEERKELEESGSSALYYTTYTFDKMSDHDSALAALYMCLTGARVQAINDGYKHEEEPMLKVTFVPFDADEEPCEIVYYKYNDNFCAAYINGVSDFMTSYSAVKSIIDGVGIVLKGEVPPYIL